MTSKQYNIMLVNAPNPVDENTCGNYAVFPAMGVVTLGTQLKKHFDADINVTVVDGNIHSQEEIKRRIDSECPDMVGLSVLTPTYEGGLDIADYAKQNGATTVLGADHACFLSKEILERRNYIDYVVQAEGGETPLVYLVGKEINKEVETPENLLGTEKIYGRTEEGVEEIASFPRFTVKGTYRTEEDIPDLGLIKEDLETLARNYNKRYGSYHNSPRKPAVVNNVRGCGNGQKKKRCIYCSIWDLQLNEGRTDFFWRTVQQYNEKHGINFFFEASDSFLTFQNYARKLVETKPFDPKEKDIEFEVYARVNDIINMPDAIEVLQALNVTRVNLGIDSGDDVMLTYLRKNNKDRKDMFSPEEMNYEAVRRLAKAGITMHVSFPLGSLGETEQSLENTMQFIERIAADFSDYLTTLEASELVPLPHSPAWDMLTSAKTPKFDFRVDDGLEGMLKEVGIEVTEEVKKQLREKYVGQDKLDIKELAEDWVEHFTYIEWNDIEDAKRRVSRTAMKIGAVYGRAI